MKIALRSHHTTLAELNLTPPLDLVLVLPVIFFITTPPLMNHLELALPSENNDLPRPVEAARVRVIGRNQIQLDSRSLTWAEFKTELARHQAAHPEFAVMVEGTDPANDQAGVDVLEIVQQFSITQVGLATASGDALPNP